MKKICIYFALIVFLLTACERKDTQTYLQSAKSALENFSSVVVKLDERIDAFDKDHNVINDPTWTADSIQVLDDLKTSAAAFKTLPTPPNAAMQELNALLVKVADETTIYANTMITNINNKDVNGIETARDQRQLIGSFIDDAQNKLIQFLSGN